MIISSAVTDYLSRRATRRLADRADRARACRSAEIVDDFTDVWRRLCEFVGLCHTVAAAAGPTVVTPRLVNADLDGGRVVLVVQLLPGQLPAHFEAVADQLAPALGAQRVRIVPRGLHWIRVELLHADPLDVDVTTPVTRSSTPRLCRSVTDHPVLVAQAEDGTEITLPWISAPNGVIQGATRSGKSVWCYSVLAQLAALDDVVIAGSDPSGLLLGRPYAGTRHHPWQVTGSREVFDHVRLLRRLVDKMDDRIAALPARADKWETFTPDRPLVVVVLEEFAGLLRLASTVPAPPKGEPAAGIKPRDQLLALYGRLVSEGHKAGFRLLVITQRADATVVGGFERGQLGLKLSFRVDDEEALPMLHGSAGRLLAATHRYAPPGVALMDTPSVPLRRVRGPRLPGPTEEADYARYWDEITAASARLHTAAA